jgi:hypothetical protein
MRPVAFNLYDPSRIIECVPRAARLLTHMDR